MPLTLRRLFHFYLALAALSLKASMARRAAFAMQIAFMALDNMIFFVFWWLLFARVPTIRGYAIGDMAVLFGTVAAGFGFMQAFAGGVRHLGRAVDTGALDSLIPQPKPTLLYALGARSQASGIGDAASGIALLALSGEVSPSDAPAVALAILCSGIVFAATGIVFQSAAFWFSKTEGVARQAWEVLVTFSLYPEPLFGGPVRLFLFTALPAGFAGYVPARFVREPSLANLALLCLGALGYGALACWVFRRGLSRYCSGSRFTAPG